MQPRHLITNGLIGACLVLFAASNAPAGQNGAPHINLPTQTMTVKPMIQKPARTLILTPQQMPSAIARGKPKKTKGNQQDYLRIEMKDAIITNY